MKYKNLLDDINELRASIEKNVEKINQDEKKYSLFVNSKKGHLDELFKKLVGEWIEENFNSIKDIKKCSFYDIITEEKKETNRLIESVDKKIESHNNSISKNKQKIEFSENELIVLQTHIDKLSKDETEQKNMISNLEGFEKNLDIQFKSSDEKIKNDIFNMLPSINKNVGTFKTVEEILYNVKNDFEQFQQLKPNQSSKLENPNLYEKTNGFILWFRKNILRYSQNYINIYQNVLKLNSFGLNFKSILTGRDALITQEKNKKEYDLKISKNHDHVLQIDKVIEKIQDKIKTKNQQKEKFNQELETLNKEKQTLEKYTPKFIEMKNNLQNPTELNYLNHCKTVLENFSNENKATIINEIKKDATKKSSIEQIEAITKMLEVANKNLSVNKSLKINLEKMDASLLKPYNKLNKVKRSSGIQQTLPSSKANQWQTQKDNLKQSIDKIGNYSRFNKQSFAAVSDFDTDTLSDLPLNLLLLQTIINSNNDDAYQSFASNLLNVDPNIDFSDTSSLLNNDQLMNSLDTSSSFQMPDCSIDVPAPIDSSSLSCDVSMPDFSVSIPDVSVSMPDISSSMPDFSSSMSDFSSSSSSSSFDF